jgi:tetratricopeptide (TPR) repeat protein
MERPNRNEFLKNGINAAITMAEMDKYIDHLESQLKERDEEIRIMKINLASYKGVVDINKRLEAQLKAEREDNKEAIRCLKNALEYYHNDKYANRAKSMKSLIDDALDILTPNPK